MFHEPLIIPPDLSVGAAGAVDAFFVVGSVCTSHGVGRRYATDAQGSRGPRRRTGISSWRQRFPLFLHQSSNKRRDAGGGSIIDRHHGVLGGPREGRGAASVSDAAPRQRRGAPGRAARAPAGALAGGRVARARRRAGGTADGGAQASNGARGARTAPAAQPVLRAGIQGSRPCPPASPLNALDAGGGISRLSSRVCDIMPCHFSAELVALVTVSFHHSS